MNKIYSLFFVLFSFFLASCQDSPITRPTASGRPYEVLVVMDEEVWKSPTGQALRDVLDSEIIGLPQSEEFCPHVSQVSLGNFSGGMKFFRNILYVHIDGAIYTRTSLHFSRDENADGQLIITVQTPSRQSFIEYCEKHGESIKQLIHRSELNRIASDMKQHYSSKTYKMVNETFGCKIYVPVDLSCYKQGENFVWTSTPTLQKHICVYSFPYEGPQIFNKEYLLAKRDSVLGLYIKGDIVEGSCMGTDTLMTDVTDIVVRGGYACEARGLWKMKKEFIGGPFVSHARVDTVNNRVIVAEGFVMEFSKPNATMMRNLEASLYTMDLPAAEPVEEAETEVGTEVE